MEICMNQRLNNTKGIYWKAKKEGKKKRRGHYPIEKEKRAHTEVSLGTKQKEVKRHLPQKLRDHLPPFNQNDINRHSLKIWMNKHS